VSEHPTSPGQGPVPLPAGRIPEGAKDWRTAEVRQWLAAVPARWAHPVWPVLALVGAVVWAVLAVPEPKPAHFGPLGAGSLDTGSLDAGSLTGRSEPLLAGSGGFAHDTARQLTLYAVSMSSPSGGLTSWWGWPTVFLGLLLLELYWIWRRPGLALAVLVPLATGALISTDALGRTVLPALVGAAVAAALAAVTLVHRRGVRVRRWERVAEAAGPQRHPLPAVPGGVRRSRRPYGCLAAGGVLLVVAAYTGGQAGAYEGKWPLLITGTLGTALLTEGVAALLRSARLHRRKQPVLRVLVREGADGKVWVYAADDHEGSEPLLGFRSWGAYEGEPGRSVSGVGPRSLREAVLYGTPAVGAQLAYVAAVEGPEGRVTVEHSTTPAAPPLPAARRTRHEHTENGTTPVNPTDPTDPTTPSSSPSASSSATGSPSWSAGPVSRVMGVFLLLVEIGVVWSFLDGERGLRVWLALLLLPFSLGYIATALNWRITADRSGLWIASGWRVRQLLWADIEKVEYDNDSIRFRGPQGARAGVHPTGWAKLDARTAKGHVAAEAAEAIRAMLADPGLRPTEDSTPAEQGMPLGPVIALLAGLSAVAVLMLG
jgi:hypothetical protein